MAFAIATGKLDLSIQGLFGVGKSRAAAILIAGLLALDPEQTRTVHQQGSPAYWRQKRMPECDLLEMTGGTHTSDRTSHWPKLEEWQRNLAFAVVDEAQQFGTDREVTARAAVG